MTTSNENREFLLVSVVSLVRTISDEKRKLITGRFFTINKMAKAIRVEPFKIIQYTIERSKYI